MPLLFRAVNPGAQTAIWPDVIDYKLDRFADKPATLSLDIAGDTGLEARAVVDAYPAEAKGAANLGDSVFRGYVMPFSTNASGIAKINVPAIEKLLDGRRSMDRADTLEHVGNFLDFKKMERAAEERGLHLQKVAAARVLEKAQARMEG